MALFRFALGRGGSPGGWKPPPPPDARPFCPGQTCPNSSRSAEGPGLTELGAGVGFPGLHLAGRQAGGCAVVGIIPVPFPTSAPPFRSLMLLALLSLAGSLLACYIISMASFSPCPPLLHSPLGVLLIVSKNGAPTPPGGCPTFPKAAGGVGVGRGRVSGSIHSVALPEPSLPSRSLSLPWTK